MENSYDEITGIQHVGIPTRQLNVSVAFYSELGFEPVLCTGSESEHNRVAFLRKNQIMVELYESSRATNTPGAINHICFCSTDIDKTYREMVKHGYKMLDDCVKELPIWENGVRFFAIVGPNNEYLEFSQIF